MSYNQKAADAMCVFDDRLREMDMPFMMRRQFNGVVNAVLMLVEMPGWNEAVFNLLCEALFVLIDTLDSQQQAELRELLQKCIKEVRKHP